MRFLLRLIATYISRYKFLLIGSIILGIIAFSVFKYFIAPGLDKNTITIGVTGQYKTEDLPDEIEEQLSRGLTSIGDNNLIKEGIAESWDTPDKGKTWVFHLKKDLKWNDGSQLMSSSVNYEFSDLTVDKPDAYTIIFKLDNVFSPFPSILTRPVFKRGLLGNGEWKVKKLVLGGGYVQTLILTDKNSNVINYKFFPTDERTKLAFKLGEVDKITKMTDPAPFDKWSTAGIEKTVNNRQIVTLFFNTQDKIVGDKTLRQALDYAIDKEALGERAIGPIPKNSFYFNPQTKTYEKNEDHAKGLLKDFFKNNSNVTIKLITTNELLNTADKIAKDWEKIGIKTEISVTTLVPTDYQAYLTILDTPVDPDQYPLWHSTQTDNNISRYVSPRIDKLLEDGRSITEIEERKKIYFDFQRFLNEDVPAIFIYHPPYYSITRI